MAKEFTEDEIRVIIKAETEESSLRKVAARLQLSPAYLSDVINSKRKISDYVASLFGYNRIERKEVVFVKQ